MGLKTGSMYETSLNLIRKEANAQMHTERFNNRQRNAFW